MNSRALMVWVVLSVAVAGGASCPQMLHQYTRPMPRILPEGPTAEQIVSAINANTSRVRTLHAPQARVDGRGFPSLRANLVIERPSRFRLTAETPLTGPEVDLGSNEELFWMWARRPQPTLYFCQHSRFASSAARQMFPIEPRWLIEAVGLVEIDPSAQHAGPYEAGLGRLRIETRGGPQSPVRVTIVDSTSGWVLEQLLYDAGGHLLARSVASNHRLDAASGAGLPQRVDVQWPPTGLELQLDLGDPIVNTVDGVSPTLFALPEYAGSARIDLSNPNVQMTAN
ncbi:MAG: hypothetical protein U0836_09905 [Pirellulales bacterium]